MAIEFKREFCTVEKASRLLQNAPYMRSINRANVARFASDIACDAWDENGETVKITPDGVLLNGHHRMLAVVQADAGAWMWFAYGVAPETLHTQDSGMPKRTHDWSHRKNAVQGYSVCSAFLRYAATFIVKPSQREMDLVWETIGDKHIQAGLANRKGRIASSAPASLIVTLAHRLYPDRAERTAEMFSALNAPRGSVQHTYIALRTNNPGTIPSARHAAIAFRVAVAIVRDENLAFIRPMPVELAIKELDLKRTIDALKKGRGGPLAEPTNS